MGYNPIGPPPALRPVTRLEQAKNLYVAGKIDFESFERRVDELLEAGMEDEQAPPLRTAPRIDLEVVWQ